MSSSSASSPARARTAIDALADEYFDAVIALSPTTATYLGVPGRDHLLDDFSPQGYAEHAHLRAQTLAHLARAVPVDDVDRVTLDAMNERLGLAQETYEAGVDEMTLNVLASPLQTIRDVIDLMPTETTEQWATIAARVAAMPAALAGMHESLMVAAARGQVAPLRQVTECAAQVDKLVAEDGYFTQLLAGARTSAPLSAAVAADLEAAIEAARSAYADTANRLRTELAPLAPAADACGRERYELMSRYFIGARVDLEETYAWGQAELARITAEMAALADRIRPGASVREAADALDADPAYRLVGAHALQEWMQGKADEAIAVLADTHFDIPEPVRRIECCIAPTNTGGIYYTGPSDDFSRPGRMWWSIPPGVTEFGTWRELTTVYHEGVPGHHLQVAQTVYRAELLNKWRRQMAWTSGHGEGWALYAERLMEELGYMDDPGNRLGLLDAQSLRAARVVLDIGVHCELPAPAEVGGGAWDYDKAWAFLSAHSTMPPEVLRFELHRYLGWPGQAPSYKVGERLWLDLRDQVRRREGSAFDMAAFHRRALDIGGVGLDTLRSAVLG